MKKFLISIAFALSSVTVINAQPVAGPNSKFRFDHPTVDIVNSQITRFELRIDSGAWVNAGLTLITNDPATPANHNTYEFPVGNLSVGLHSAQVKACNVNICGGESNILSFRIVSTPATPILRLGSSLQVVGVIQHSPYPIANVSVIDVSIPEYNVVLNIGSPTWHIPGVYSAAVGDKVFLSLSK